MSEKLETLQLAFEQELKSNSMDNTVENGLDELLRTQAFDEQAGSPILRMIAALPVKGYKSLSNNEREYWLRRALATIRYEKIEPSSIKQNNPTPTTTKSKKNHIPVIKTREKEISETSEEYDRQIVNISISATNSRLGKNNLQKIESLGIFTVFDALYHFPHRYNDFTKSVPISELIIGQEQTVYGTVGSSREVRMGRGGRMRSTEIIITDDAGASIKATWFNQPFITKALPTDAQVALAGRVTNFRGRPVFQNPEFEIVKENSDGTHTGRLVPVYPLTKGLAQRTLRNFLSKIVSQYSSSISDHLPKKIRKRNNLLTLSDALAQIHYPDGKNELQEALRRIAFDDLFAIQLTVQDRKRHWQATGDAPQITSHNLSTNFLDNLPFTITSAQQRVLTEIRQDLNQNKPMSRLLEGDVGSGKTVVALAAILDVIESGFQAVLMAPTEVLAEQHYRTICKLLAGEDDLPLQGLIQLPNRSIKVVLLTGSTKAKNRNEALSAIKFGGAQIIIGTHSLIQDSVSFSRLGLAVVDEQHRFGVRQRERLREQGRQALDRQNTPHLLVMSATPIPRSLALTVFGDLDLSIIDEMPTGRTSIETTWLPPDKRSHAFHHIRTEIKKGHQVFVICPLVEDSEAIQSRAAIEEYTRLCEQEFPDLANRILLLHGRMKGDEKEKVMRAFANHEADILVSTAVVEVGIDIPNATAMIIEGAERFGLAQLHQFRGRVGRGAYPSFCYLLSDDPSNEAKQRLSILEDTTDGFSLAQADLELRGPGDLYGTAQSGLPNLRVATLLDAPLIEATKVEATQLLDTDPELVAAENQSIKYAISKQITNLLSERN